MRGSGTPKGVGSKPVASVRLPNRPDALDEDHKRAWIRDAAVRIFAGMVPSTDRDPLVPATTPSEAIDHAVEMAQRIWDKTQ